MSNPARTYVDGVLGPLPAALLSVAALLPAFGACGSDDSNRSPPTPVEPVEPEPSEPAIVEPEPVKSVELLSYVRDIQPIWDKYCVRCHGEGPQEPHLKAPDSWANLQSLTLFNDCNQVPLVTPGYPEQSYLFFKISGETALNLPQTCRRMMPAQWNGGGDVPLAQIDPGAVETIREWIRQGASAE